MTKFYLLENLAKLEEVLSSRFCSAASVSIVGSARRLLDAITHHTEREYMLQQHVVSERKSYRDHKIPHRMLQCWLLCGKNPYKVGIQCIHRQTDYAAAATDQRGLKQHYRLNICSYFGFNFDKYFG